MQHQNAQHSGEYSMELSFDKRAKNHNVTGRREPRLKQTKEQDRFEPAVQQAVRLGLLL